MNNNTTIASKKNQNSFTMLRAMVGIGVACALLIVLTYEGTKPRIEQLKAEALEQAIFKVLPGITKSKTFMLNENNQFEEVTHDTKSEQLVYAGYDEDNKFVGVAIEASGQGYADVIRILYGYNPETQKVVGFYVLESKETPGLGDKIEKDENFLANFDALDVSLNEELDKVKNRVVPVKDGEKEKPWEIDGISGATISSRTIGKIMGASTGYWVPLVYKNREDFIISDESTNTR